MFTLFILAGNEHNCLGFVVEKIFGSGCSVSFWKGHAMGD
jgi:hypothetical protein